MAEDLTPKQAKFVEEYLIDLNATKAAIRAGYSPKTAYSIGFENLKKPDIQEAIQARQKELQTETQITQVRVLQEEAKLAFQDIGELFGEDGYLLPVNEIPEDARRAIAGIEITERFLPARQDEEPEKEVKFKYRMCDKGRSLERVSKHLGLYAPEKKEITGKDGGPIETRMTDFPTEPATIAEWEKQRKEAEEKRKAKNGG